MLNPFDSSYKSPNLNPLDQFQSQGVLTPNIIPHLKNLLATGQKGRAYGLYKSITQSKLEVDISLQPDLEDIYNKIKEVYNSQN